MSDEDDTPVEEPAADESAIDEPAVAEASPDPEPGSSRGWRIAAAVAVIAALAALGVLGYLLFAGSSTDPGKEVRACIIDPESRDFTESGKHDAKPANCPPKGSKQTDGLVEKTSKGGFTMREIQDGRLEDTITLYVREPDRPYIDIAHAQTHAALGQPIRVYTKEIEGRESVVYMEDAPLLG
jgi:hypothetical protein